MKYDAVKLADYMMKYKDLFVGGLVNGDKELLVSFINEHFKTEERILFIANEVNRITKKSIEYKEASENMNNYGFHNISKVINSEYERCIQYIELIQTGQRRD